MSKIPTLPFTALLFLSGASAQSMDYASIEQLFGEPATMSATGTPQRATDVPANMIIITKDDIRRSGGRDIPSILRHVAGVDVLEWANDDFDVSARGYNQAYSARTLVLIDGRQVYADSFGFTPWSALPVELGAIRQIEVVKGPNAALFGFNAVAGIINIITDNPRYDDSTQLALRYGSQSTMEASGTARFAWGGGAFFRLSAGYRRDKPFSTSNPLAVDGAPQPKNDRKSVDADAVFRLPDDVEFDVQASHTEASQTEVSGGYKLQTSEYGTNSVLGRVIADTGWGLVRMTGYGNWFAWARAVGPGSVPPKLMNKMGVAQIEDVFSLAPDHTIRIAAEYRHNEVEKPADSDDGWVAFDAASGSVMWNWQIQPTLAFTSALRFDSVAYDSAVEHGGHGRPPATGSPLEIDQWSFNTGLVWNATTDDTVRLIAARGVQLPNLVQVWDAAAGQAGMPDQPLPLRPSAVTNFELLWNRRFTVIDARLQLGAFHQDTDDVISTGSGTVDALGVPGMPPSNVGSSQANGLEAGMDGSLAGNWTWSVSYRLEIINDNYRRGAGRTDLVNYEDTTPQHVVKLGLGWSSGPWEANAFVDYQSESAGLRRVASWRLLIPVQSYTAVDARLAYRFSDHLSLALSGQDLFNAQQQQTSGPNIERRFFVTLAFDM